MRLNSHQDGSCSPLEIEGQHSPVPRSLTSTCCVSLLEAPAAPGQWELSHRQRHRGTFYVLSGNSEALLTTLEINGKVSWKSSYLSKNKKLLCQRGLRVVLAACSQAGEVLRGPSLAARQCREGLPAPGTTCA